jgi:hypothetical protein
MTRPTQPTTTWSPRAPEWDAYLAAEAAWEKSPEGVTTLAAEKAKQRAAAKARFDEALPGAIEKLMRNDHWSGGPVLGLPQLAVDIVLSGMIETPALAAVRGAEDICILAGAPGTSKTVSATAWVHEYIARPENWTPSDSSADHGLPHFRGTPPLWISAAQLARISHFEQAAVDAVAKARRLVIDDLGSEYRDAKGYFQVLLDEIVNARYASKLPTVITTNLDSAGFADWYGSRIIDRIREAGRFFNCGNVSLRRRSAP